MKRHYSRSDWGARPAARPMTTQGSPTEAFIHYADAANASAVRSLAAQKAACRSIQNFHIDGRGWSDFAYHYLVFQAYGFVPGARAFRGRDVGFTPAAQEGHNTGTLAICVFAGPGDELRRNTRWLIEQIIRKYPTVRTVGAHRDVTSTDCPGDKINAEIARIAHASGRRRY